MSNDGAWLAAIALVERAAQIASARFIDFRMVEAPYRSKERR